jgi:hypothetical protein
MGHLHASAAGLRRSDREFGTWPTAHDVLVTRACVRSGVPRGAHSYANTPSAAEKPGPEQSSYEVQLPATSLWPDCTRLRRRMPRLLCARGVCQHVGSVVHAGGLLLRHNTLPHGWGR